MPTPDAIDAEIDALYAGGLEGFVDARKALAAKLRKAGDRDRAAAVAALPKPIASAWLVNDLARSSREAFDALLGAGTELRAAMRAALHGGGDAQAVAKLQREQRDRIEALIEIGRARLASAGVASSDTLLGRTRVSLTALSTRGDWGDVPPGRLAKDLDPIDMAALAALLDVAAPRRAPTEQPREAATNASALAAAKEAAVREASRAQLEAKAEEEHAAEVAREASLALTTAEDAASAKTTALTTAEAEADDLERRARKAREETAAAKRAVTQAHADLDQATRLRDRTLRDWEKARARTKAASEALVRAKA